MKTENNLWKRLEEISNPRYNNYKSVTSNPWTYQEIKTILLVLEIDIDPRKAYSLCCHRNRSLTNGTLDRF